MILGKMNLNNTYGTIGIATIEDLGNAQQVRISMEYLKDLLHTVQTLKKLGFDEVVLTVEKNSPLIVGSLKCGIAVAPRVKDVDLLEPEKK
jgi:hypothetical protein